jgi:hypothetical protein
MLPRRLAAIVGRAVRGRGHRLRLAFRRCPTRRTGGEPANTASVETPVTRPTSVEDQVSRPCAMCAASFSTSASVSSRDSSAILP